jgi:hypothetical protein
MVDGNCLGVHFIVRVAVRSIQSIYLLAFTIILFVGHFAVIAELIYGMATSSTSTGVHNHFSTILSVILAQIIWNIISGPMSRCMSRYAQLYSMPMYLYTTPGPLTFCRSRVGWQ